MSSAAEKIAERALPEVFTVVFKAGGWEALKGFAAAFGGKKIRIPRYKVGDCHPLVVAAGRAAADAIVERFGSTDDMHIPVGGHSLKLLAVHDAADLSLNQLAKVLGCTYRHALNLSKEAKSGSARYKRRPGRPKLERDPRQLDIEDFTR